MPSGPVGALKGTTPWTSRRIARWPVKSATKDKDGVAATHSSRWTAA